jgi:hypothetical protein
VSMQCIVRCRAPGQPVLDRDAAEDARDGSVQLVLVHRPSARCEIVPLHAGPEGLSTVALSIAQGASDRSASAGPRRSSGPSPGRNDSEAVAHGEGGPTGRVASTRRAGSKRCTVRPQMCTQIKVPVASSHDGPLPRVALASSTTSTAVETGTQNGSSI